jgi:hypothetical protein
VGINFDEKKRNIVGLSEQKYKNKEKNNDIRIKKR